MVVLTDFPCPTEGIRHREDNTSARIQAKDLGKGTLFIAESRVSWVGEDGQGFSLEYPAISLHAISRDLNAFPQECLYLMIDAQLDDDEPDNENDAASDENDADKDDEGKLSEIRFIPENKSILDSMFRAMSDCQALHPDPADSASDDGYDDEEDEDEAEYDVSAAERQYGPGDHLDNNDQCTHLDFYDYYISRDEPMELGQFEDAEPEH